MGRVLVQGEQLQCPDGGAVSLVGNPKLTVGGQAVSTVATASPLGVANCTNSNKPCGVGLTISGPATKLTVGGAPAVLDASSISSTTQAKLTVPPTGQTKLTAG